MQIFTYMSLIVDGKIQSIKLGKLCNLLQLQHTEVVILVTVRTIWTVL
jgi:hypothetical protein